MQISGRVTLHFGYLEIWKWIVQRQHIISHMGWFLKKHDSRATLASGLALPGMWWFCGEKKKTTHKTNHLCPSLWNDGAINSSNFSSKDWSVSWELLSNDSLFHLFFLCCVEYILVGLEREQSQKQYLAEEFLYVQKEIPTDNIQFTASSQRKWITANHAKLTWKITRDVKDVKLGLGYWISEFVSLLVHFLSLWFQIWKQF